MFNGVVPFSSQDQVTKRSHATTRVHYPPRRRCGGMAVHGEGCKRMQRIGFLIGLAADDREWQARGTAFVQGLQELG
jgi:hypothetical protein